MKNILMQQKKLGIRNFVGRWTGSMVGNYCFGVTFFQKIFQCKKNWCKKIGVKKLV